MNCCLHDFMQVILGTSHSFAILWGSTATLALATTKNQAWGYVTVVKPRRVNCKVPLYISTYQIHSQRPSHSPLYFQHPARIRPGLNHKPPHLDVLPNLLPHSIRCEQLCHNRHSIQLHLSFPHALVLTHIPATSKEVPTAIPRTINMKSTWTFSRACPLSSSSSISLGLVTYPLNSESFLRR